MFSIQRLSAIELYPKTLPKEIFDRPTLVTPHVAPANKTFPRKYKEWTH